MASLLHKNAEIADNISMKHLFSLFFALQIFGLSCAFGKDKEQDPASVLVTAMENEKVSEAILSSKLFKKCKQEVDGKENISDESAKDDIRQCIMETVAAAGEGDLEEIGRSLEISSAKFKETKGAKSLKEYLHQRIFNAIHGENAYENKKLKELKFVDQGTFLDLYKTQISKNLILEVSQYCLENVAYKDTKTLLTKLPANTEEVFESNIKDGSETIGKFEAYTFAKAEDPNDANSEWSALDSPLSKGDSGVSPASFWGEVKEVKYCAKVTKDNPKNSCHETSARNAQQISALKDAELKKGKGDSKFLQDKFATCSNIVIKNMCEIYRCNNVYTQSSNSLLYRPDDQAEHNASKVCSKLYGIAVGANSNSDDASSVSLEVSDIKKTKGQIACNVLKKVERYKNTFAAIDEIKKKNQEIGAPTGFSVSTTFKDVYNGKGIDEMTSISSKELVKNVDGLDEESSKELEEKCLSGGLSSDEECQALVGSVNQADLTKIQLDTEAETQAYLARVKKLKDEGKDDEIKQYLIDNGLHEYAEMYGEGLDAEQAVALISDKYKADRKALINNMQKRFENLTTKAPEDSNEVSGDASAVSSAPKKEEVAKNNLEEMKQRKERLETLFNYSNIVSSYLTVSDGKGHETQNTRARDIETKGIEEYAPDEKEAYDEYFVEGGMDDSKESISAQGKFIDNILGLGASEQ